MNELTLPSAAAATHTSPRPQPMAPGAPSVTLIDTMLTMCSHYEAIKEQERYHRHFGVETPADPGKHDLWPGYGGVFIRRHPQADVGDAAVPEREALPGLFGLILNSSISR